MTEINNIQTSRGLARVEFYDDGIAQGIRIILNDEIVAMLDVFAKQNENDINPEARILIYSNGSDEPTDCITI